ncbi:hypothetical protein CWC28_04450 [Pseudoalteromonas sp. S4492]|nr:hypothetical protein CWC28_04450 [Pseudoalteromonas sp. S4492]
MERLIVMINKTKVFISVFFIYAIIYLSGLSLNADPSFYLITLGLCFFTALMLLIDKEIVNPISILFPFVLGSYYYQFMLSDEQVVLSSNTVFSIFLFIFSYVLGVGFVLYNKKLIQTKKVLEHDFINTYYIDAVFVFSILIFFIECVVTGGFPFFIALIHKVNIYEDMFFIPVLHYLVMLSSIFPAIYYFQYKRGKVTKLKFYVFTLISLFVLVNIMSRQVFILSVVFFFFVYAKSNKISPNRYILKVSLFSAFMFLLLGFVRIQSINNSVSQLEYLKAYAQVPSARDVNTFDVTFNLYTSQNLVTLDEMVNNIEEDGFGFGKYTIQALIKTFKYDSTFNLRFPVEFDSFKRLGTIIADPYLDFGFFGVFLFAFIYGVFNSMIFMKAKYSSSVRYTLFWAMICYVMLMSVFTNFFNVLFTWIVFLFVFSITYGQSVKK